MDTVKNYNNAIDIICMYRLRRNIERSREMVSILLDYFKVVKRCKSFATRLKNRELELMSSVRFANDRWKRTCVQSLCSIFFFSIIVSKNMNRKIIIITM